MRARPIVFRCDGDEIIGAGHVARCLPLARAFSERGRPVAFVGRYDGLAAWLLSEAQVERLDPRDDSPLGIHPPRWEAAVLDLYEADATELCELAHTLPTATIAESRRCREAGIVVDYHLDRAAGESSARLLAGRRYAPIDPRFAGARGRPTKEVVASALITVGATRRARELLPTLIEELERAFPGVAVRLASGGKPPAAPSSLIDAVSSVDLAVSAAGFTAYELACAGVPSVVLALAENQRRVARACERAGVAIAIDAVAGPFTGRLAPALGHMRDARRRRRMARAGQTAFDGHGAARTALALAARWGLERPWSGAPGEAFDRAPGEAPHREGIARTADRTP